MQIGNYMLHWGQTGPKHAVAVAMAAQMFEKDSYLFRRDRIRTSYSSADEVTKFAQSAKKKRRKKKLFVDTVWA